MVEIDKLLKKYVRITKNLDQLIQSVSNSALDSPDPHIRFRVIQWIPDLVVGTFKKCISAPNKNQDDDAPPDQRDEQPVKKLTQITSFNRLVEKLLMRAKGDKTESIRIEAQSTIRSIIRKLEHLENDEVATLLFHLNKSQIIQLKQYVNLEEILVQ